MTEKFWIEGSIIKSSIPNRMISVCSGPHDRQNMMILVCRDFMKVPLETTYRQSNFDGSAQDSGPFYWPINTVFSVPEYMPNSQEPYDFETISSFSSIEQQEEFIDLLLRGLGKMRSPLFREAADDELREVRLSPELREKLEAGVLIK